MTNRLPDIDDRAFRDYAQALRSRVHHVRVLAAGVAQVLRRARLTNQPAYAHAVRIGEHWDEWVGKVETAIVARDLDAWRAAEHQAKNDADNLGSSLTCMLEELGTVAYCFGEHAPEQLSA